MKNCQTGLSREWTLQIIIGASLNMRLLLNSSDEIGPTTMSPECRPHFGGGPSTDTVQSRMDELVERDVLKSEKVNNGFVYWVNYDDSEWPIPPDVEVEPERTEPTISEWKNYGYVQLSAFALFIAVIGTAITLIGTFQTGGFYTTPWGASNIIAVGLSAGIVSYFALFLAGLLWIFDIDRLPSVEEFYQKG